MSPEEQKKVEDLQLQVTTLTKKNQDQETELTQATKLIEELKEKLAEKEAGPVKVPTLKIGSDTYEFHSEFHYKGQDITLELLKEDADLAKELVNEKVGDLRKVVTKK